MQHAWLSGQLTATCWFVPEMSNRLWLPAGELSAEQPNDFTSCNIHNRLGALVTLITDKPCTHMCTRASLLQR